MVDLQWMPSDKVKLLQKVVMISLTEISKEVSFVICMEQYMVATSEIFYIPK